MVRILNGCLNTLIRCFLLPFYDIKGEKASVTLLHNDVGYNLFVVSDEKLFAFFLAK